jgi:peptidoglycan/LPS O-acetylase OafA/YrhL
MSPPRAWELALGALLVFLPARTRGIGETATALGLALIAAGFVTVSTRSFPGIAAILPCVGAAFVIWPKQSPTIAGRCLGWLSPIGLVSYSLYLWHWPVWVLFRFYINASMPGPLETSAIAAVSFLLATLSYRYVERPFRKRGVAASQSYRGLACGFRTDLLRRVLHLQDGRLARADLAGPLRHA